MDKTRAIAFLHQVILDGFPAGPERQRWLAWLNEFSHAEERLNALDVNVLDIVRRGNLPPGTY